MSFDLPYWDTTKGDLPPLREFVWAWEPERRFWVMAWRMPSGNNGWSWVYHNKRRAKDFFRFWCPVPRPPKEVR